jgi:rhamnosyltransferase
MFSDKYARIELTNLAFETRELTKATADPWARATLHATCDNIYRGKTIRSAVKYSIRRRLTAHPSMFKLGYKVLKKYHSLRERMHRG